MNFPRLFCNLCLRRCLQACRKSRRLRDRCNVAEEHVFVLRLRFPFLQLDSRIWPAISSTLGPRCRLDVLGKAGKSEARPPCGRMFVRIVLSALWDLSRFVRTLGRELLCPRFRTCILLRDTLRGSSSPGVVLYRSSKATVRQNSTLIY